MHIIHLGTRNITFSHVEIFLGQKRLKTFQVKHLKSSTRKRPYKG